MLYHSHDLHQPHLRASSSSSLLLFFFANSQIDYRKMALLFANEFSTIELKRFGWPKLRELEVALFGCLASWSPARCFKWPGIKQLSRVRPATNASVCRL